MTKITFVIITIFLMSNQCTTKNVIDKEVELAQSLSNDSIIYLAENLVPITNIRHIAVSDGNLYYSINHHIVFHSIDSGKQTEYITIDPEIIDMVTDKLHYRTRPYQDEVKTVSTKYVHEEHGVTYEGMKTLMHRIDGLYADNNSLEIAANVVYYRESPDNKLHGANGPSKLIFNLSKNRLEVVASNYDFINGKDYYENHFYLVGDNEPKYDYGTSFLYYSKDKNPKQPILLARLSPNGLFDSTLVERSALNYNRQTKLPINEFFQYSFYGQEFYFANAGSDTVYAKGRRLALSPRESNIPIYKKMMSMTGDDFKDYRQSHPFKFTILDMVASENQLKILIDYYNEENGPRFVVQTYDNKNSNLLSEESVEQDEIITSCFSNDAKYLYTLHLDDENEMYYIKKVAV